MAAVGAAVASIPKFADGGIAYGPTLGIFGEYAGASNNPEVVAPLDKLKSIIGLEGGTGGGKVEFVIDGRVLKGILRNDRTNPKENRIMAMQVIYTGSFRSVDGVLYRVDILSSVTSFASSQEVKFAYDTPVEIEWNEVDKLEPVQGSCLTLTLQSLKDRQFINLYPLR